MKRQAYLLIGVEDDDLAELVLLDALCHDGGGNADEEGHGRRQVVGEVSRQDGDEDMLPVHRVDKGVGGLQWKYNLDFSALSTCGLLNRKALIRSWTQAERFEILLEVIMMRRSWSMEANTTSMLWMPAALKYSVKLRCD